MEKRIFALLAVLCFAVPQTGAVCAAAGENIECYTVVPYGETSEWGYREYKVMDSEGNLHDPEQRVDDSISLFAAEELPSSWDSRESGIITSVKNQGVWGTCWAHSMLSSMETNMIKKGYETTDIDYSELHTAYFRHKRNETLGDGSDVTDSDLGYYGGDNQINAAMMFESRQGTAYESELPYPPVSKLMELDAADRYISHAHMKSYGIIYTDSQVKSAVMEYGSVVIGYHHDNQYLSSAGAYYQNTETSSNHAVTVVGWDDNYSRENFNESCRPEQDGAWLIKNSWGSTWGNSGYFWLSYSDASIKDKCFFDMEPAYTENVVYHYDGEATMSYANVAGTANVFKAEEAQTLTSVGFNTVTNGGLSASRYTVQIYTSETQPETPVTGTLKRTLTGSIAYDGFHTAELDEPLTLSAGEYFSVVLQLKNASGQPAYHRFEGPASKYSSQSGQSYALDGSGWHDLYDYPIGEKLMHNVDIKAYAQTEKCTVKFDTGGAGDIDDQILSVGDKAECPAEPVKEGYTFLGWYRNGSYSEEWDFDTPITGDMTLRAKWYSEPKAVQFETFADRFGTSSGVLCKFSAEGAEKYTVYFKSGGATRVSNPFGSDDAGQWWRFSISAEGSYTAYVIAEGANSGETVTSDTVSFTVTSKPAVGIGDKRVSIVNVTSDGAVFIGAEYDNSKRLSKKMYNPVTSDAFINLADSGNTKYMLWSSNVTPLCEARETGGGQTAALMSLSDTDSLEWSIAEIGEAADVMIYNGD